VCVRVCCDFSFSKTNTKKASRFFLVSCCLGARCLFRLGLAVLADDDAVIRRCLRRAVEADPRLQVKWEADNGLQALLLAKQHHPHVILMDAEMPRMDGIEATRCLRQCNHDTRVIVLSVYDHYRASALAAGANAFLVKDAGCEAIRTAIRDLFKETE